MSAVWMLMYIFLSFERQGHVICYVKILYFYISEIITAQKCFPYIINTGIHIHIFVTSPVFEIFSYIIIRKCSFDIIQSSHILECPVLDFFGHVYIC
jgi:hypothetical protein